MMVIKDMCIDERRGIAYYELFKINDRLETINYLIQVGAHKEEKVAITAAWKAVQKAWKVLSKRLETEEGKGMWPVDVTFDDEGGVESYYLGTQKGWEHRTDEHDGFDAR